MRTFCFRVVGDAGAGVVAAVVGGIAVVEAVGHREVEDLVGEWVAEGRANQVLVSGLETATVTRVTVMVSVLVAETKLKVTSSPRRPP